MSAQIARNGAGMAALAAFARQRGRGAACRGLRAGRPSLLSTRFLPSPSAGLPCVHGGTGGGLSCRRAPLVTVGEERVREFIQAELRYFGLQQPAPIKLHEIVAASTPELVAELVFTKLPPLFAARIKHIEALAGWEQEENLVELRHIFLESFRVLRLMELKTSDMSQITELVLNIRERHRKVTPLLASVLRNIYRGKSDQEMEKMELWADVFMKERISTEVLTAHYEAFLESTTCSMDIPISLADEHSLGGRVGIVDIYCDPGAICKQAATDACRPFEGVGVEDIAIEVQAPPNKIEFSYIPKYLKYIVQELIQNSIRATLDAAEEPADAKNRPIQVLVAADNNQVAICIRDKSGGLPTGAAERVWSYAFSTAGMQVPFTSSSPLTGRGLGLPLSRLYAAYLGGSLEVMNVSGVGVDAYLFLQRIDPHSTEYDPPM